MFSDEEENSMDSYKKFDIKDLSIVEILNHRENDLDGSIEYYILQHDDTKIWIKEKFLKKLDKNG